MSYSAWVLEDYYARFQNSVSTMRLVVSYKSAVNSNSCKKNRAKFLFTRIWLCFSLIYMILYALVILDNTYSSNSSTDIGL